MIRGNMFELGTKLWYSTPRIQKPLECEYVEPVEDAGSETARHWVQFCQQTDLIVQGSELFETKEEAKENIPKRIPMEIDIVKLLLGAVAPP